MIHSDTLFRKNELVEVIDETKGPVETGCLEEMRGLLERERVRAERSGFPLSLALFVIGDSDDGYTFAAHVLWKILARSEGNGEVGWFDDRHIGVVLPGFSPERSAEIAGKICAELPRKIRLGWTVFGYPHAWLDNVRDYARTSGLYSGGTHSRPAASERQVRILDSRGELCVRKQEATPEGFRYIAVLPVTRGRKAAVYGDGVR